MERLHDRFLISLYAVAILASLMLAGAEGGSYLPTALTLPIGVAAYVLVERRGRSLPVGLANALGLAAVVVALLELLIRDVEGRILFGAHLLVYLSWIVLWQPKATQQQWGLIALSVLQVAVGSVLTSAGLYGIALLVFVVLVVWTLVLLQLSDVESKFAAATAPIVVVDDGPQQLLAEGQVTATGASTLGQLSLRPIVAVVAVTVTGAVCVGAAFFLLIPRIDVGRQSFRDAETPLATQRVTGFTERVRLGEFGAILESSEPVFDVRLYDDDGPVNVETYTRSLGFDEPLFRGLTLHDYERGEWTTGEEERTRELPPRPFVDYIRQEYRLKSNTSEVLFAISPVYAGQFHGTDHPIRWRRETETILRPEGRPRRGESHYEVFSPRRASGVELFHGIVEGGTRRYAEYLALPEGLEQLRELAAAIARPDGTDAPPALRAQRLLHFLRDSGQFRYSLSGELIDPQIDPVEDFLINRRSGHCEYFASALALMLRAEGIPSRVVNGFKGGVSNRFNNGYEVQQRHAHAWVEALLDDQWETFDPSPASERSDTVEANAPVLPLWSDFRSALTNLWQRYVLQLDMSRQQQALAPLRRAAIASIQAVRDEYWPSLNRQIVAFATDPSRWVSWQGGVATFVGLTLIVILWRAGRRLKRRMERLRKARDLQRRRGRRIGFYERFRKLCQRRGWIAEPGQTPREFAADVRNLLAGEAFANGTLAAGALPSRLVELPRDLTEAYYQVRFGNRDLTESRMDELGARLSELEAVLSGARPRKRSAFGNGAEDRPSR